jgi:CHAT domain-containing protein/tetratricopeptide (TPR) repeat protein
MPAGSEQEAMPLSVAEGWHEANQKAFELFQQRKYPEALRVLGPARKFVELYGPSRFSVKTLLYFSAAEQATFQYRDAIRESLLARETARRVGDLETVGVVSHNLSNLYYQLFALEESLRAADEALAALSGTANRSIRAKVLLHKARLTAREGSLEKAVALFNEGISVADAAGETLLQASGWELLGYEYLRRGRLQEAETALQEAFRIRILAKDGSLATSYQHLSMLRYQQGDYDSALRLINHAMTGGEGVSPRIPPWNIYDRRAQVLLGRGDLNGALRDLREAIEQIRDSRLDMAPTGALQVSTGVGVQEIYSLFIETAAALYFQNGDQRLVRESLAAAEANRAVSLRQASGEDVRWRQALPAGYATALAELHWTYGALYRNSSEKLKRRVEELRLQLSEMEASAGMGGWAQDAGPIPANGVESVPQSLLRPVEGLSVFHLGADQSYVWMATADSLTLHRLPSRDSLTAEVRRLEEAIAKDSPEAATIGETLYATLFGAQDKLAARADWILVPDEALYQLPFAALVTGRRQGSPVYLVEKHSLRIAPGLWALRDPSARKRPWDGASVAIGDPIYNQADPRWTGRPKKERRPKWLDLFPSPDGETAMLQLPRLPGSVREIEAFSRIWPAAGGSTARVLTGAQASRESVEQALAGRPSIIHFATHIIPSPENAAESLLALSLDPAGQPNLLGPEWIASRELRSQLVMMSGCRSGKAEAKPGEGLMGLTRAWLLAGAQAVAGTHWPIPDDPRLVESFYRHWQSTPAGSSSIRAGRALRSAQVEMIRSASFRDRPRYWASYFLVGKN